MNAAAGGGHLDEEKRRGMRDDGDGQGRLVEKSFEIMAAGGPPAAFLGVVGDCS